MEETLNKELESYYEIVNLIDKMALGEIDENTSLLEEKALAAENMEIEDIASANDCFATSCEKLIDEFRELHKSGLRGKIWQV